MALALLGEFFLSRPQDNLYDFDRFRGLRQMLINNHVYRKLVIIGDGACGKTSLLSVFTLGYFPTVSCNLE